MAKGFVEAVLGVLVVGVETSKGFVEGGEIAGDSPKGLYDINSQSTHRLVATCLKRCTIFDTCMQTHQ